MQVIKRTTHKNFEDGRSVEEVRHGQAECQVKEQTSPIEIVEPELLNTSSTSNLP